MTKILNKNGYRRRNVPPNNQNEEGGKSHPPVCHVSGAVDCAPWALHVFRGPSGLGDSDVLPPISTHQWEAPHAPPPAPRSKVLQEEGRQLLSGFTPLSFLMNQFQPQRMLGKRIKRHTHYLGRIQEETIDYVTNYTDDLSQSYSPTISGGLGVKIPAHKCLQQEQGALPPSPQGEEVYRNVAVAPKSVCLGRGPPDKG